MFKLKNELITTQIYILSKKEKKEFLKQLKLCFDTEAVEYIFNNFDKMTISKISLENSKRRIISYESNPIFFEYANDAFCPSVYLLNMFPDLMNRRAIIFEETDSYLANGADLMLKGILNREDIKKKGFFKLGELFYVQTISGVITSIGTAMVSSSTMNVNIPSGKFLKIVHRFDDALWNMGNRKVPSPNENFKKNKPSETTTNSLIQINQSDLQNLLGDAHKENHTENFNNEKDKNITNINDNKNLIDISHNEMDYTKHEEILQMLKSNSIPIPLPISIKSPINNNEISSNQEEKIEINENLGSNFQKDDKNIPQDIEAEEGEITSSQNADSELLPDEEDISKITPEIMDQNIENLFLTLMKIHFFAIRDTGVFPLDPGKLLRDYMKPLSIEMHLPLDFKLSSYKKINNFLKSLQKEKNLITFGKPKGMQNDFLISVLWEHPIIKDFLPRIKKIKFINQREKTENITEKENVILQKDEKIEILQKFKPNQKIKNFFIQVDPEYDEKSYYPIKYCNEILISYLKQKNLLSKEGLVKISEELEDSLYKTKQNVFLAEERIVKMDDILLKWKENLNEKSFITKTNSTTDSEVVTNNQFKVKIFAKKLHNKNVTIVDGLQNFLNVKDVIKTFSKHFACSVTLKDFQEFKDAIFIQGYWVNELQTILLDEIKLNKKFIHVEDKLKLKKK